jgi:mono/diheme cytochrome c family protein/Tol biopolymer transport system component
LLLVALCVAGLGAAACASPPEAEAWAHSEAARLGDMEVTLRVDTPTTAAQALEIQLQNLAGEPLDLPELPLKLSLTELEAPLQEQAAPHAGGGRYRLAGRPFPLAGRWLVEAQIPGTEPPASVAFALYVARAGEAQQALLRSDEQSLAVGGTLYTQHCAGCHGPVGLGDGPDLGLGAEPLPELPPRMQPGQRTDGQLFAWTHDGISGTSMPGYGLVLGDTEIWQIVAFLRSLGAPNAPQATRVPPAPTPRPAQLVPEAPEALPPLVFVGQGKLWRSDGFGEPQVLVEPGPLQFAEDPVVSPDGTQIAFVTLNLPDGQQQAEVSWSLYTVALDGSNLRLLGAPSNDELRSPAWATDGAAVYVGRVTLDLAADATSLARHEITRVELASGAQTTVTTDAIDPTISADSRLAYVRLDPQTLAPALMLGDVQGGPAQLLLDDPRFTVIVAPRFSPDGQRILFAASDGPPTDEAGQPIASRPGGVLARLGAWLAPASALAHGAPQDLWSVETDGSGLRRLTLRYEDEPRASFSPDSSEIIWMSFSGIYRMDADGANIRRISPLGDHGGLAWLR